MVVYDQTVSFVYPDSPSRPRRPNPPRRPPAQDYGAVSPADGPSIMIYNSTSPPPQSPTPKARQKPTDSPRNPAAEGYAVVGESESPALIEYMQSSLHVAPNPPRKHSKTPSPPRRPAKPETQSYTAMGPSQGRFPVKPDWSIPGHSTKSSMSSVEKPLPSIPIRLDYDLQNKTLFGGCVSIDGSSTPTNGKQSFHKRSNGRRSNLLHLLKAWWLEGLSIIIMFLSLLAIVLTLRMHQGQPLPDWPYQISINSLLSVYYTIFKGAMLLVVSEVLAQLKWTWFRQPRPLWDLERFNEASRGPRGARQLLWASKTRLKASALPVIGALLVLFALLIDPFTQSIVIYYNCQRMSSTLTASVPRTNNFTSPSWLLGAGGYGGTQNVTIDLGIQGAVYAGLFESSPISSSYVPSSCPSGNCTFDPYWSLGMCGTCEDVTSDLQYVCKPYSWWNESSEWGWSPDSPLCNYTSPNVGNPITLQTPPTNESWAQLNISIDTGPGLQGSSLLPTIVSFRILSWFTPGQYPIFSEESQKLPDDAKGAGAAVCSVYPCLRQYQSNVTQGNFQEEPLQEVPMPVDPNAFIGGAIGEPAGAISVHVPCLNDNERSILSQAGYGEALGNQWLALHGSQYYEMNDKINNTCLYSMLGNFFQGAPQIFVNLFGLSTTLNSNFKGIYGGLPDDYDTAAAMQALNDYGNVTFQTLSDRFQNVGQSLTSYMRRVPGAVPAANRAPAKGIVWETDTCVAVRWMWLILPGSLFILTTVYFVIILTILARTRFENMWKSSSIALLYHGLDGDTKEQVDTSSELRNMEETSRELEVQLQGHETGWRFVGIKSGGRSMTATSSHSER